MAENKKEQVVIEAKAEKAFKVSDGTWYNVDATIIGDFAQFNKGNNIEIEYYEKGISKYVTKMSLIPTKQTTTQKEEPKPTTGFKCACGKELKDGTFKKCYDCNMKAKEGKTTENDTSKQEPGKFYCVDCKKELKDDKYEKCFECNKKNPSKKKWGKKNNYDSPEKTAQIQRGNALNAAAAVVSGNMPGADIETLQEMTLSLANVLLDWLRLE